MTAPPIPPHNIEAEQALLGSILFNNKRYGLIAGTVDPAAFFEPLHAQIFHQAGQLIAAGKVANVITIKDAFPDMQLGGGVSVVQYLARLVGEAAATEAELQTMVSVVRDTAQMRSIIGVANDLQRSSSDGVLPNHAVAGAWDQLDELRASASTDPTARGSFQDFVPLLLEKEGSFAVASGLADLDQTVAGGWRSGRLYILAGRPGMGKTVLGASAARRVARKGVGVSIFSLEIDAKEIMARLVADELAHTAMPIPYRDIVAGSLDAGSLDRVAQISDRMSKLPIRIDATGGLSMTEIEARSRIDRDIFARSGVRLGAVVVDYLGLIKSSDRYRGQRVHELGEIALAGKTMAKRLDCAVIMLAQLNRSVENRDDKRPIMADLRDSGNIEEHADFVGLLYRPFYYIERSPGWRDLDPQTIEHGEREKDKLELIVGKNRLGSTRLIKLWCDPALSSVDNLSRYGQ
ncbi:replicative DNA helicase [Bradyrhizobium elkanii]|uniref:replicative DNA helicase n=1 Tax=Bradyrhizobium elkanii TaxID=29448 RepID=UPI0027153153|nr:DnaB-like helicase C-terminal domain-containing protein [Bradyrhizobium elkanii]WLA50726.1 DnaB-like helicase C-terminal domain-containing protein [Bradyrhizobium elkanii]WLB79036.1 DnaB-like helicase C-terminal domain-containing protein [Bradyrhizobium elkanii]